MSITDRARDEAERQWPPYPAVGFSGAEDRQAAFIAGAEWAASLPLTDEEVRAAAFAVMELDAEQGLDGFVYSYIARAALTAARKAQTGETR